MSSPRWYALYVRPNCEKLVAVRLREFGIEDYLPYHKSPYLISQDRPQREALLFPGYVFCHLDLETGPRLYSVTGVIRILSQGRHPTPLEESEIEAVRRIAESSLIIDSYPCMQAGEPIRVIAGPLEGIAGTILRSNRGNKLVVSLPLLQRSLAVTIPSEWVVPRSPAA